MKPQKRMHQHLWCRDPQIFASHQREKLERACTACTRCFGWAVAGKHRVSAVRSQLSHEMATSIRVLGALGNGPAHGASNHTHTEV